MVITGLTGQENVAMKFSEWNAVSIDNTVTATADGLPPKTATGEQPACGDREPANLQVGGQVAGGGGRAGRLHADVRNEGTASATNIVVTDQIPPKLEGVTVTTTKGARCSTRTPGCSR